MKNRYLVWSVVVLAISVAGTCWTVGKIFSQENHRTPEERLRAMITEERASRYMAMRREKEALDNGLASLRSSSLGHTTAESSLEPNVQTKVLNVVDHAPRAMMDVNAASSNASSIIKYASLSPDNRTSDLNLLCQAIESETDKFICSTIAIKLGKTHLPQALTALRTASQRQGLRYSVFIGAVTFGGKEGGYLCNAVFRDMTKFEKHDAISYYESCIRMQSVDSRLTAVIDLSTPISNLNKQE